MNFVLPLLFAFGFFLCRPALAQGGKWTPPPAIELSSLIATDSSLAAKKIRGSRGRQRLASGKHRWIEKTTLLVAVLSEESVALYRTDTGENLGDLTRLDEEGLYALARDVGNVQVFSYEIKTDSGKVVGANRRMETALDFMDYESRYWWGPGFHGSRHAAVMLPEMLTWLWSE